jgi:hypothetical protein
MGAYVTRIDPKTGQPRTYYKDDEGGLHTSYQAAVNAKKPKSPFNLNSVGAAVGGWFRDAYNKFDNRFANGNLPGGAPARSSNRSSFPASQGTAPPPQRSRSSSSSPSTFGFNQSTVRPKGTKAVLNGEAVTWDGSKWNRSTSNPLEAVNAAAQWVRGQAEKVNDKKDAAYGFVDRLLGGVLPGGADSPLIGSSFDQEQIRQTLNNTAGSLIELGLAGQVPALLDKTRGAFSSLLHRLEAGTQVPLYEFDENQGSLGNTSIDRIRKDVNKELPPSRRMVFGETGPLTRPRFSSSDNSINLQSDFVNGYNTTNLSTALHEMGHGIYNSRFPNSSFKLRGYNEPMPRSAVAVPFAMKGSISDENTPFWQAALEGAAAGWLTPGPRNTLNEEFQASKIAVDLAKQYGLPTGRRSHLAALGTYAASLGQRGAVEGVLGEISARAADALGQTIEDNVMDPIADKIRGSEYTPIEQSLLKYGYNEGYRLKRDPQNLFSKTLLIEKK